VIHIVSDPSVSDKTGVATTVGAGVLVSTIEDVPSTEVEGGPGVDTEEHPEDRDARPHSNANASIEYRNRDLDVLIDVPLPEPWPSSDGRA
jgi:hypothetical protein